MPTKYVEVQGCATYYYYAGQTTLPDVVPDLSRGPQNNPGPRRGLQRP